MDNKIIKIYQKVIYGIILTKEILQEDGFTEEEIEYLVEKGILTEEENKYQFEKTEMLYRYGVSLLVNRKPYDARICFRKCYDLEPTNKEICLQLMVIELKLRKYKEVMRLFSNLQAISTEKDRYDNNLYLYLLSSITKLEEPYLTKVQNIEYDDLVELDINANHKENEVRRAVARSKYTFAFQMITDIMRKDLSYNPRYELLKELTLQTLIKEKEFKQELLHLARNKQYYHIFTIIKEKQETKFLSLLESTIYELVKIIIEIQTKSIIPTPKTNKCKTTYEAVMGHNYQLAKEINDRFIEETNSDRTTDTISILLDEVISLIKEKTEEIKIEVPVIEYTKQEVPSDELSKTEEIAYYLSDNNIDIQQAIKQFGLRPEQILMIKLIYARDYYIEGLYPSGDILVKEVEQSFNITQKVLEFLNEIKNKRNEYINTLQQHTKKRTII